MGLFNFSIASIIARFGVYLSFLVIFLIKNVIRYRKSLTRKFSEDEGFEKKNNF